MAMCSLSRYPVDHYVRMLHHSSWSEPAFRFVFQFILISVDGEITENDSVD